MAKDKKGFDINNNFENLKAQMLKKKDIAENMEVAPIENELKTSLDEVAPLKSNPPSPVNSNSHVSHEVNSDVNINVHHPDPEGYVPPTREYIEEYIDGYDPQRGYVQNPNAGYIHVPVEVPQNPVSMSKIVIKRMEKPEQPKRITYYLRPETIKKIDKFSRLAGMGKSEFVQQILDTVLNNLEIEK